MTLVLTTNALGEIRGTPTVLSNRRRRLSTVVAKHRPSGRQNFIVSVHKRGDENERYFANDKTVRLRAQWPKTLLGPNDVVVITRVPRGKSFLAIGLAIASIALIAIAPYAAPIIAGAAVFGAGAGAAAGGLTIAIQAGLVIGGVALGYAAQMAKSAGNSKKKLESYSLSGGGNVPKPNSRKPLIFGKCWTSPPLSQQDYIRIETEGQQTSQVIVKRMTLGIGKFQCHKVKVGDALFWDEATGIQAPFNTATGDQGAAIEFLYEKSSSIMPGDVFTSPAVSGQEVPRAGSNPSRTPWYRLTPQGVVADGAQMNWTYPAIYRVDKEGKEKGTSAGIVFYARKIDPDTGEVIGGEFVLWASNEPSPAFIRSALRRNAYFRLPEPNSTYEVCASNPIPEPPVDTTNENRVTWDAMAAFKDDTRVRLQTTEIVFRMKAVKGVTVTAYSDISVQATRILPVWDGSNWVEQPTRKAIWAYCDLVRSIYGLNLPDSVDKTKALYYANLYNDDDTFDGQLPEVSSFWEGAGEVLLPFRSDPIKVGQIHTFVRDEPRDEPRHVITRRQIIKDSASATYKTKVEGSDVIVEFNRDGDPRRPDEVRYSYGPPSRTPKRYKINGIVDGTHATKHATWLAAVAVFRGNERKLTMEWDGRLVFPGDHALVDIWYLNTKNVWGVANADGNFLELDTDADVSIDWSYGSIRTRAGREWGILRMRGFGARGLELHPDDVKALEVKTQLSLSSVLNSDSQGPTTIAMGELTELQETFVARSGVPTDPDNVQIEMVKDDVRVWQLLDETPIVPSPIDASSLDEPLVPVISVLHARCNNIETGIEIVYGVSETFGARNYEFDLTYDQSSWEILSAFGSASTGRAMIRQQIDTPITVRARAFGRTGLPGAYVYTTVTTVAPVIDGSQTTIVNLPPIDYAGLAKEVQLKIDHILEVEAYAQGVAAQAQKDFAAALERAEAVQDYAEGVAAQARADFAAALARAEAVQDYAEGVAAQAQKDFAAALARAEEVQAYAEGVAAQARADFADAAGRADAAGAVASSALSNALQALRDAATASAQVVSEATARSNADEATTQTLNGAISRIGTAEAAIVTEASTRATADEASVKRVDGISTRVGNNESSITSLETSTANRFTAQATKIDKVEAKADTNSASIVTEAKARSDEDGSLSTRIDSVKAESASNTAAIISEQTARANEDYSLAQSVLYVNAVAQGNVGAITSEATTRADADGALGRRVDTVQALADGNSAAIVEERTARVTDVSAVATYLNTVAVRTEGAYSAVSSEAVARNDQDTSLSQRIDSVTATAGNNSAAIISETTARSNDVYSLSQSINYVNSVAQGNVGAISSEATTRADADGALGRRVDTVQALADGNSAAIVEERTARVTDVSAVATYLNTVAISAGNAHSAIASEASARYDQDTSIGRRIDSVTATVGNNTAAIINEQTARSNDVSSLSQSIEYVNSVAQGNVGAISSEATTRADADGALGRRVDTVQALADGNSAAIVEERTARVTDVSAVATYLNTVAVRTEGAYSAVSSEAVARNDQDTSLSQRIDSVTATAGNNSAAIINEQTARSNDVSSLSQSIEYVNSVAQGNVGAISSERTARSDADGALGSRIDTVQSKTDSNAALIVEERTARTNDVSAVATYLNVVATSSANAHSAIASEATTRYDADGALGSRIDSVISTTNGNTAAISAEQTARTNDVSSLASSINYVNAKTDKGTATGRFSLNATSGPSGVTARLEALLATSEGGQTRGAGYYLDLLDNGQSRFVIDANAFYITSGGSSFPLLSFDGGSQTLQVPNLRVTSQAYLPNSISQSEFVATGDTTASYTLTTGPNAKILIIASYDGQPGRSIPGSGGAGILRISRDGNAIRDVYVNYYLAGNNDNRGSFLLQTTALMKDTPTPGQHTYSVTTTLGLTGVNILVLALAA